MATQTPDRAARRRMLVAFFALAGALIAFYLSLFRLGVLGRLACGTSGGCETVQLSEWSRLGGIPIPYIASFYYTALVIAAALGTTAARTASSALRTTIVVLSFGAFAFALYNTAIEVFVVHVWCRWCLACAGCATVLAVLAVLELRAGRVEPPAETAAEPEATPAGV